jgi:hypothetical protein
MMALLTLSQIKLWSMALRREMTLGWWISSPVDGIKLILLGTMASELVFSLHSNFLQPMCSGVSWVLHFLQRRAHLLPLVQPHLMCLRVSWVDWLVSIKLRLRMACLPSFRMNFWVVKLAGHSYLDWGFCVLLMFVLPVSLCFLCLVSSFFTHFILHIHSTLSWNGITHHCYCWAN